VARPAGAEDEGARQGGQPDPPDPHAATLLSRFCPIAARGRLERTRKRPITGGLRDC
jgi:hypothetical protein